MRGVWREQGPWIGQGRGEPGISFVVPAIPIDRCRNVRRRRLSSTRPGRRAGVEVHAAARRVKQESTPVAQRGDD